LLLTGGAMQQLKIITPEGMASQIDLTITDEHPLVHAFVIISAVPDDGY
jgi:holo-[acyl-carrier protein] synthase